MSVTIEPLSHQTISVKFMGEMQMCMSNNLFIWKHCILFPKSTSLCFILLQAPEKALKVNHSE